MSELKIYMVVNTRRPVVSRVQTTEYVVPAASSGAAIDMLVKCSNGRVKAKECDAFLIPRVFEDCDVRILRRTTREIEPVKKEKQ